MKKIFLLFLMLSLSFSGFMFISLNNVSATGSISIKTVSENSVTFRIDVRDTTISQINFYQDGVLVGQHAPSLTDIDFYTINGLTEYSIYDFQFDFLELSSISWTENLTVKTDRWEGIFSSVVSKDDTSVQLKLDNTSSNSDTIIIDIDGVEYMRLNPTSPAVEYVTIPNLEPSRTYDFRIGYSRSNILNEDDSLLVTTDRTNSPPLAPVNVKWTEKGDDYVVLSWDSSLYANDYTVRRDGVVVYSGKNTVLKDTGLTPGATYTYTIEANNENGSSSSTYNVTAGSAIAISLSAQDTRVSISLTSSDPAVSRYTVTRIEGNKIIANKLTYTYHVDTGLQPLTYYSYKVEGFNSSGVKIYQSIKGTTTTKIESSNANATIYDDHAYIYWNASSAASYFQLKRDGVVVYTGSAKNYNDYAIETDVTHYYELVAFPASGPESDPFTFSLTPRSLFTHWLTNVTTTDMTLNWGSSDPDFYAWGLYNITTDEYLIEGEEMTSWDFTGLSPNTTYDMELSSGRSEGGVYVNYISYFSVSNLSGEADIYVPSSTADFGTILVDGTIKSVNADLGKLNVTNETTSGWNITVSSTPFIQKNGTSSLTLPTGSLQLNGISSVSQVSGSASGLPSASGVYPKIIDMGAVKILSANTGAGIGGFDVLFPPDALTLMIDTSRKIIDPANSPTIYQCDISWVISTGP